MGEIEARLARGQVGIGLTNRNAKDDRSRGKRHLVPPFGKKPLVAVTLATIMEWIDKQRAAGELSEASIATT